jgi:hypothetical protein
MIVIGELKLSFNLELVLQAVDRAALSDEVWIAAKKMSARGNGRESDARFRNLCRRLGFGMLGVSPAGEVSIIVSPISPMPRKDLRRRSRLIEEHRKRIGDPAVGGSSRQPIMTAYRQRALACAAAISNGVNRPRDLKPIAADATAILRHDYYGWFERVERGVYSLTPAGQKALRRWPQLLPAAKSSPRGSQGAGAAEDAPPSRPRAQRREHSPPAVD